MRTSLDEIDITIIDILKENSRTPYTDIAKRVKMSEAAVRKRVDRLVKAGIIRRFTIEVEERRQVHAIVLVEVSPTASNPKVAEQIAGIRGVERVYEVAGSSDIVALLAGDSIDEVNSSVDDVRGVDGVLRTNTLVVLKRWK
ncbi:MAG: Lrp/AsnC family transcriptional regulator [Candidatus Verstraetearchaeota archaeon]|nr:Lrp/AsnC family transcriptional regulator [Candidatus Verstraetearchaeota archaeon]